jgi:hypothetical protein
MTSSSLGYLELDWDWVSFSNLELSTLFSPHFSVGSFCRGIFGFSEGILYIPFCGKFRQGFRQSGRIEDSGPRNIESELGIMPVAITAVSCD